MKVIKRHFYKLTQRDRKNTELINEFFSDEEWKQHKQPTELSKEKSERMYAAILKKTLLLAKDEQHRVLFLSRFYNAGKYVAAASIILLTGLAIWLSPSSITKKKEQHGFTAVHTLRQPVLWEKNSNTSETNKYVHLPDLSLVKLYPGSSIRYEKDLSKTLRDIYLIGKARFNVEKDPTRPFSVYAGGIKTTALGTAFTINTKAGKRQTSVVLHHGKIVIVPNKKSSKQGPMYLSVAGSKLIFNRDKQVSLLMPHTKAVKVLPDVSQTRNGSVITMKNLPLRDVLALLSDAFHVTITAESEDIKNITYTGEVDIEKENIEDVLQVISLINNMSVSRGAELEYILK